MKIATRGLLPLLIAAAASTALASAGPPRPVTFSAVALNESRGPSRGDSINVRSDTRSIRAFTVRYTRGVRGHIPRLKQPTRAIAFVLLTGPESTERFTGHLTLPAGGRRREVRMTSKEMSGLRATFRAGRTPQLRLSGLPAETHEVEMVTVGRGRRLLRNVGRCIRHRRHDANVFDVQFVDGRKRKTNRHHVSCGYDFGPSR